MRNLFLITILLTIIGGCNAKDIKGQKEVVIFKDSIFVDHKFNSVPWVFKFSRGGDIYISDGYEIARVSQNGKLKNSIRFSPTKEEITPIVDIIPIDSSQFFASARGNIFTIIKGSTKILNSSKNEILRISLDGFLYSTFQDYDASKDLMYNGFHCIKDNYTYNYPDKFDYSNLNFEIIDEYLMFYSSDGFFYKLPIDTLKEIVKKQIPILTELNDRIWFLGKEKDNYVFKYNDFNNEKKDIIFFFDNHLNLVKKASVNHTTSDNVKSLEDYEFSFQYPSGILYSYNNYDKTIYLLKNIKSGIYIYKLNTQLKTIK